VIGAGEGCIHPHAYVDVVTGDMVPTADIVSGGCKCGAQL
jgi:hypothetical protein